MNNKAIAVPGYQIGEQLYCGSRTQVYRGICESDQKPAILKLLKSDYPTFNELLQFRNQYTIAKNLDVPGVVKHLSLESYHNGYVLVMEDFGGISLKEWTLRGIAGTTEKEPLPINLFLPIAIQITQTLEQLYAYRVIHKDIKPHNILINPQTNEVKLIDFSISSLLPRETQEIANPNVLEGTLAYMSPEQTGRMNRGIDYRSDFYSLGVTFYELLTGQLPFQSNDMMELVHCHIARMPKPAIEIAPGIPKIANDIVMKLMAKTAEDRYQTAFGIKYDLERCWEQYSATGSIAPFTLGERDISERFAIPEKLYGRSAEVAALLQAFDRVAAVRKENESVTEAESDRQSQIELMLVAGFSGIGKTAVVNEVHKPIVRQRGYFIKGKFDQFKRNIPFSAWVQAFQNLMRQLLTENNSALNNWKAKILAALGENGQLIIDVIPELELLIGKQPPVPELEGNAAQNRFNLLWQKFIQVFATPEHPLVIFLDDLQWADSASLKLIQLLMSETDTGYLLLIGAYRDNEVSGAHPLMLMLDEIRAKAPDSRPPQIERITLAPLDQASLNCLIADTLSCSPELAIPLTELAFAKTKGNPFFTNQFLKALHEDGLISFDFDRKYWQCDIAKVRGLSISDDVVEFMATQLQKLPINTQTVLKLAACIGNEFDLATLAIVREKSLVETAADLWKALQEGLVIPESEVYKFFQDEGDSQLRNRENLLQLAIPDGSLPRYKFLHDRVQQASYSLIPESDKKATHLQIGQLLLKNTPPEERKENIFDLVNQLNYGWDLLTDEAERYEIAQLNLVASQTAKASTAYEAALRYLNVALEILRPDSWSSQYDLTLALYVATVEVQYLNANYERSQALAELAINQAKTLLDKVKLYTVQIQSYIAQNQMKAALDLGLQVLEMLEITLEQEPPKELIIDDLINLPEMTNPAKIAAIEILAAIVSPAAIAMPTMMLPIILTTIKLCSEYGNSSLAIFPYSVYGVILCGAMGDIDSGYKFGQLALKLLDKFNAKQFKGRVAHAVSCCILFWKEHPNAALELRLRSIQDAQETGDIEYVCYTSMYECLYMFLSFNDLQSVVYKQAEYVALIQKYNNDFALYYAKIWRQATLNFLGHTDEPFNLIGHSFNETEMLPWLRETNNLQSLHSVYVLKTLLSYLFRKYELTIENARIAEDYQGTVNLHIGYIQHNFYYSLGLLAQYPHVSFQSEVGQESEQKQYLNLVDQNQKKLKQWSNHCSINCQHKFDLVEAEKARILGQYLEAIEYYERAISGAKTNGYLLEEALTCELAAQFYLSWNKEKIAQSYLIDAYYAYARWGAKAKVKDLEQRYPQLLAPITIQEKSSSSTETILQKTMITVSSTGGNVSQSLDLAAAIKASHAIAQEVQLDRLLSTLIQVAIENAGASKCALILAEGEQLAIAAIGSNITQVTVLPLIPLEDSQEIPQSIINYVYRTRETLVINDVNTETTFAADAYIIQQPQKSILCTPIIHQSRLTGILYLENNLAVGAFTKDRLELLKVLSAQAAISIENAQLYQTLETKVAQRTAELAEANQQLAQANAEISDLNHKLKADNLRMSAELEVTKKLQQMILPKNSELEAIEGLEIAGFMEPADEVGGDYYDVIPKDGKVKISIGDVTGHGLESGVLMIMAQTAVRTLQEINETDPVKFLDILNRTLYNNIQRVNSYKNMTLALLDYSDGILSLSGQHEEIIVVRSNGELECIDTIDLGFPIGLEEEITDFIAQKEIQLNPGDAIVLYTDGITEAPDINKRQYGLERLCEVVQQNRHQSAAEIRQAVIEDLRRHIGEQKVFDDITLVVMKQK